MTLAEKNLLNRDLSPEGRRLDHLASFIKARNLPGYYQAVFDWFFERSSPGQEAERKALYLFNSACLLTNNLAYGLLPEVSNYRGLFYSPRSRHNPSRSVWRADISVYLGQDNGTGRRYGYGQTRDALLAADHSFRGTLSVGKRWQLNEQADPGKDEFSTAESISLSRMRDRDEHIEGLVLRRLGNYGEPFRHHVTFAAEIVPKD